MPEPFEIDERMLNKKELIMRSKQIFDSMYPKLNESQKKVFEEIISENKIFISLTVLEVLEKRSCTKH